MRRLTDRAGAVVTNLQELIDEASRSQERLIKAAYEAGRVAGRDEATAEMWKKLGTLLPAPPIGLSMRAQTAPDLAPEAEAENSQQEDAKEGGRATPGSVKPEIARLVAERPGVSTRELENMTGFKLNSIRGTLWTLQKEGVIERRGDGIYPAASKNEAVGTESGKDAPTASVEDDHSDFLGSVTPVRDRQVAER